MTRGRGGDVDRIHVGIRNERAGVAIRSPNPVAPCVVFRQRVVAAHHRHQRRAFGLLQGGTALHFRDVPAADHSPSNRLHVMTQKFGEPGNFGVELARERRFSRPPGGKADLHVELPSPAGRIRPTHTVIPPEHRHRIVAANAFRYGGIRLESIRPSPQVLEPHPIPYHRIERSEKSDAARLFRIGVLRRRPDVAHAIDLLPLQLSGRNQCRDYSASAAKMAIASNDFLQTLFRRGRKYPRRDHHERPQAVSRGFALGWRPWR